MHKKANEIKELIGYEGVNGEDSIEEKVFKALHPKEE